MDLCSSQRRQSLWASDLPPELAGLVLRWLPCHIDRLRFRAVCRQWRLAALQQRALLPPALPFIFLSDRAVLSLPGGELRPFGSTSDVDVPGGTSFSRCRGCINGSWFLYEPSDNDDDLGKSFLVNPPTGATVEVPHRVEDDPKLYRRRCVPVHKIIVCSPDLIAGIRGASSVSFCRPGAPTWPACPSDPAGGRGSYVDIALYRGKIYALNGLDDLFVHEIVAAAAAGVGEAPSAASHAVEHAIEDRIPPDPEMPDPGEPLRSFTRRCSYLVVSCTGKLLMVKLTVSHHRPTRKIKLKVFEADLEMRRWSEVDDLADDEALFVGGGCSKALRLTTGSDQRFQGNGVYVLGYDIFGYCCYAMPSYAFYNMRNRTVSQVFLDRMMEQVVWPVTSMEWFFPLDR